VKFSYHHKAILFDKFKLVIIGLLAGMMVGGVIRSFLFDDENDMGSISSKLDSPKPTSKDTPKTAIPIVSVAILAMGLIQIANKTMEKKKDEQIRKNISDLRSGFLHDHEEMYEKVDATYDEKDEFFMKLISSKLFQTIINEILRGETRRKLFERVRRSKKFRELMKKMKVRKVAHKFNRLLERFIFLLIGNHKNDLMKCLPNDSNATVILQEALIKKITTALNYNSTTSTGPDILPITQALFYTIIQSEGWYLGIIKNIIERNLFANTVFLLEIFINTVAKNFIVAKPKYLAILSFSFFPGTGLIVVKTISRKQLRKFRIILLVLFGIRFANIETCDYLLRELEQKSFVTVVDGKYKTVTKYELPSGTNEWEKEYINSLPTVIITTKPELTVESVDTKFEAEFEKAVIRELHNFPNDKEGLTTLVNPEKKLVTVKTANIAKTQLLNVDTAFSEPEEVVEIVRKNYNTIKNMPLQKEEKEMIDSISKESISSPSKALVLLQNSDNKIDTSPRLRQNGKKFNRKVQTLQTLNDPNYKAPRSRKSALNSKKFPRKNRPRKFESYSITKKFVRKEKKFNRKTHTLQTEKLTEFVETDTSSWSDSIDSKRFNKPIMSSDKNNND